MQNAFHRNIAALVLADDVPPAGDDGEEDAARSVGVLDVQGKFARGERCGWQVLAPDRALAVPLTGVGPAADERHFVRPRVCRRLRVAELVYQRVVYACIALLVIALFVESGELRQIDRVGVRQARSRPSPESA